MIDFKTILKLNNYSYKLNILFTGHTIIFNKIHIQQLQVIHVQPRLKNVLMRLGSRHWIGGQLQLKIVLRGYHYLQVICFFKKETAKNL